MLRSGSLISACLLLASQCQFSHAQSAITLSSVAQSLVAQPLVTRFSISQALNSQTSGTAAAEGPKVVSSVNLLTEETIGQWKRAINNDETATLIALLNAVDDKASLMTQRSATGKSALMIACKTGDLDFVQRLLRLGADPHAVTKTGGTPFMFAVLGKHPAIATLLVELKVDVNAQGSNGWSASTIAAAKGYAGLLRYLLREGADINAQDVYRWTPLMRAVDNGHLNVAELLAATSGVDLDNQDEAGNTALHHAIANEQIEMVMLLIEQGAATRIENFRGQTPRDLAHTRSKAASLLSLLPPD